MKTKISIEFDEEKLRALEMALKKERSSVRQHLSHVLDRLYEKKVPEPVREFIDSKSKRPPRSAAKAVQRKEEVRHEQ